MKTICFGSIICFALIGIAWAKARDHWIRIQFELGYPSGTQVSAVAVCSTPPGRYPAALCFFDNSYPGEGGGRVMRQISEHGLAAISCDWELTSEVVLAQQVAKIFQGLNNNPWISSNKVAWIGWHRGANAALKLAARYPRLRPPCLVAVDSDLRDLERIFAQSSAEQAPAMVVLLLRQKTFGAGDIDKEEVRKAYKVGNITIVSGLSGSTEGLPDLAQAVTDSVAAEFCASKLGSPDWTVNLDGGALSSDQVDRFNTALVRAGENREGLWKAVKGLKVQESQTAMMVVGGLEDYDLAHISGSQLRRRVKDAWKLRNRYPWCRDAPLEIFARFVASHRINAESQTEWNFGQADLLPEVVKYCKTTEEAADALDIWMGQLRGESNPFGVTIGQELPSRIQGGCHPFSEAFVGLGRIIGLPCREAYTFWPTIGNPHFWNEVWDIKEGRWHAFDASALNRPYHLNWFQRVPKSTVLVPDGERGAWNALPESRWEAFTNTIRLFYPSGQLLVTLLDGKIPVPGRRILVQVWLGDGMGGDNPDAKHFWVPELFPVAAAVTDVDGKATFDLGHSAEQPYRVMIDGIADSDWQWVAVCSNCSYQVTLQMDFHKSFDIAKTPPILPWKLKTGKEWQSQKGQSQSP